MIVCRIALMLVTVAALLPVPAAAAQEPSPAATAFFENEVRPVLAKACFACHGAKKQKSSLRLDSRTGLLQGGERGPAVVPGDPGRSLLIAVVSGTHEIKMPPRGKLTAEQIGALKKWIALGAPWPGGDTAVAMRSAGTITDKDRQFWSFQPLARPAVPATPTAANPVDAFILQKLHAQGLTLAAPADRRTLLRRATFDLIGLPPTPEEIDAFLADTSPEAFAKVVDRLLASPHYGERWGRHWLDVVRYADTAGETADYPVPEARLYRDYVIDSFNRDRPYDEFVREQIAGDLLASAGPRERYAERVVATGFIAISRRFGFDPQNYHHLTIQDTIDTLGQAVLGLTLGCARCHDHKYDPVTREDYYALYGIFASTKYAFPGSEEKHRPADMVPLMPAAAPKGAPAVPVAYGAVEGKPQNARLHVRGEPRELGPEVPRRFLAILGGDPLPKDTAGSGRRQLADWLTRPANPLTPRVLVNRIWQHHFGVGLVATENDFGLRGKRPTHPELLDYLARRFQESGWSMKAMHRLIMLSATYQQASGSESAADPENRLLSHFPRRRLDAESIRDAMLAVGGNLDCTPGGAHPFPPVEKWGFTQHNPFSAVYDTPKRSVYLMTARLKRHPYLALFDGPDTNASTPRRLPTTVPTQALFFMNDPFVHSQAAGLAKRVMAATPDTGQRLMLAFTLTLARPPSAEELRDSLAFLGRYRQEAGADGEGRAWAALARTLLARNEFLYVD